MTAVFTISASGEHLDASTLALLAEVDLDEMSIRAFSEDLAADSAFDTLNALSTLDTLNKSAPQNLSADGDTNRYPWTTNGLLEAAKHLSACKQCSTERTVMLSSFETAWQEPLIAPNPGTNTSTNTLEAQTLVDRHIAAALVAFDETVTPAVVAPAAAGKLEKNAAAGALGFRSGRGKPGAQDSGVGWKASGFGRAIGLRRNQILVGFASLALAVPLLLQLRSTEQFGGVAMKNSDTSVVATAETEAAASEEFAAETQTLAETTEAMAAETAAAAAPEPVHEAADNAPATVRVPAASHNQDALEPAAQLPAVDSKGALGAETSGQDSGPINETEDGVAAIENEFGVTSPAPLSKSTPRLTTETVARPAAGPVTKPVAAAAPLPSLSPSPPAAAPLPDSPIDAAAKAKRQDSPAVGGAITAPASPAPKKKATKKTATTSSKSTAKAAPQQPAGVATPAAPAAAATAAPAAASSVSSLVLDPSVLNLGNLGTDIDPTALVARFRNAYDQAKPQASSPTSEVLPPSPAPAAAAPAAPAPAVNPAPAVAVGVERGFGDSQSSTIAPSSTPSLDRCITALFGPNRRVVAAATATVGNRSVLVVRVSASSSTFDVVIEPTTCTELLRLPVPA